MWPPWLLSFLFLPRLRIPFFPASEPSPTPDIEGFGSRHVGWARPGSVGFLGCFHNSTADCLRAIFSSFYLRCFAILSLGSPYRNCHSRHSNSLLSPQSTFEPHSSVENLYRQLSFPCALHNQQPICRLSDHPPLLAATPKGATLRSLAHPSLQVVTLKLRLQHCSLVVTSAAAPPPFFRPAASERESREASSLQPFLPDPRPGKI